MRKKLTFPQEVRADQDKCSIFHWEALESVTQEALQKVQETRDPTRLAEWIEERVFQRRSEFATTRSPAVGVGLFLVWVFQQHGVRIHPRDLNLDNMTTEGIDSAAPFVERNQFPEHPIEDRYLTKEFYEFHDFINPDLPAQKPLQIPEPIQRALAGGAGPCGCLYPSWGLGTSVTRVRQYSH